MSRRATPRRQDLQLRRDFLATTSLKRQVAQHRMRQARTLKLLPVPPPPEGCRYALFLSHCWGTGQDQVHGIKKELAVLVPTAKVFLDVDDLSDFSAASLQAAVRESACVMLFLSRGYFKSK